MTSPQLPVVHGSVGVWGAMLNTWLQIGHRASGGTHTFARVVTEYGADPTGAVPSSAAINAAITASQPGEAIVFPGGSYTIDAPILIKANRAYIASGTAVLRQQDATEVDAIVMVDPTEAYPRRSILWFGVRLDGNAVNASAPQWTDPSNGSGNVVYSSADTTYTRNRGMVLDSVQFSNFIDLHITGCGNTGLHIEGTPADIGDDGETNFNKTTSTLHFVSPYVYGNGKYGVYFGPRSDDNHIVFGDIGANRYENVYMVAGSSSVRVSTVWGSVNANGVLIGGPTNQIVGCQIEGNAQHGIKVVDYGSYAYLESNKVYYNSNGHNAPATGTPWPAGSTASDGASWSNLYDGIYVGGTNTVGTDGQTHNPKYVTINDNFIYAGIGDFFLDSSGDVDPSLWVGQRQGITLDTYHQYATVNGNNTDLNAPGAIPDNTRLPVFGLVAGDVYNGLRLTTSAEDTARLAASPVAIVPGAPWYRPDTAHLWMHTGTVRGRAERIMTRLYDVDAGNEMVASGATTMTVTIPNTRFDASYTVVPSPSWNTTWWVTDKFTNQFTVHFGTAPGADSVCDWHLFRQSDI